MSMNSSRTGRDPGAGAGMGDNETALIIGVAAAVVLVLAALVGISATSWITGSGWLWPHDSTMLGRELHGLVTGDPARYLTAPRRHTLPTRGVTYAGVIVTELAVMALACFAARWAISDMHPRGSSSGLASRTQAQQALGIGQLTRQRAIEIRPDLYGRRNEARASDRGK